VGENLIRLTVVVVCLHAALTRLQSAVGHGSGVTYSR